MLLMQLCFVINSWTEVCKNSPTSMLFSNNFVRGEEKRDRMSIVQSLSHRYNIW